MLTDVIASVTVSFVDPLHVEYLGGDLVPEVALDYCSSWYRCVQQKDCQVSILYASLYVAHCPILSFCLSPHQV